MKSETQKCKKCQGNFTLEPDDFSFYEKMRVPAPKICPDCRFKMRAVFRNERTLYNSVCKLCGRSIITMYNPHSTHVVYCNDCWISDKWDPYSYGMDYDFGRPFFDQLKELVEKVPKSATYSSIYTGVNINSEYANFAGGNKDGYLIFNCGPNNENCAYSRGLIASRDVFDVYFGDYLENVYECVNAHKNNGVVYGQNVYDSIDSRFLLNCSDCINCFACVNLRHKSYHFFNEPLPRDEWLKRVNEISGSYEKTEEMKRKFSEFLLKFPCRESNNLKTDNCSGDYIFESKNCLQCFEVSFSEDMRYSFSVKRGKDCSDMIGHCRNSELLFNGVGVGAGSQRVICSWWVESSQDVEYSFAVRQSKNCIGCASVKGGNFVILNKRYDKEEYQKIRDRIVKELKDKDVYGEFFPSELAFFAYNETIAQDNFPLTKEKVISEGFKWAEDIQKTEGKGTLSLEKIPDHIKDAPDSVLSEILTCVKCSRNYRLIKRELEFYRKMLIPIPRICWNCRFVDRIARRGPYKFWNRNCTSPRLDSGGARCNKEIITNYSPERSEIVYCEKCYQQ
ncbi:MAG: hypothetical protein AAB933_01130, partial [Patescibacteria group bacterium]